MPTTVHKVLADSNGRILVLDITINNYRYKIVNIYAPNEDDPSFFEEVLGFMEKVSVDSTIIMGDFNTVLEQCDIKSELNKDPTHPKCIRLIKQIMKKYNLIDIWRLRHPNSRRYTWCRSKPYLIMERLDYFLVSGNITSRISQTDIDPSYQSDHSIPNISLWDLGVNTKGPGFWKLNVKLLDNEDYKSEVLEIIENCINQYQDINLRWEMIK